MRSLALGVVTIMAIGVSVGAKAADLAYPPPLVGPFQHGAAPPPAGVPPQVIVVPGPTAPPQHNGAPIPPPVIGSSPHGVGVASPVACPPVWRCGDRGCNWRPGCAAHRERYSGPYEPGPQVYSGPDAPTAQEPYSGPYAPQVYSGPAGPYAGDRGPYRP
jgi:hypothetical protein